MAGSKAGVLRLEIVLSCCGKNPYSGGSDQELDDSRMLGWLETSAVANWVALSFWAYPALLSVHILGLAIVVGIYLLRDLSLLGVASGVEPRIFLNLAPLAGFGFGINLVSGLLLFSSQATVFAASTPFLLKIICVTAGMLLAGRIHSRLRGRSVSTTQYQTALYRGNKPRLLAAVSLVLWLTAIGAGRLIAYF